MELLVTFQVRMFQRKTTVCGVRSVLSKLAREIKVQKYRNIYRRESSKSNIIQNQIINKTKYIM